MADNETKVLTLEELSQIVLQQQTQISNLSQENLKLKGAVLKEDTAEKKPEIPKEPVSFGGKKYAFKLAVFTIPGVVTRTITAEEASTDEDLIAEILEIEGQGILKELV